ncbi:MULTISPECIES: DEAD/DEAH box helicase [unclassified Methylophaga]|uniref:DEAD/DEAH box helicase n=1 Tax=unclassified Methylophaga TaxID=2629249 RepID=UPI000C976E53|nr:MULTISPECIES: DEAD/DEAH box helicase family protein [unclassified Methylophaga]MBN45658.1 helicase [Methylophaga sp.]
MDKIQNKIGRSVIDYQPITEAEPEHVQTHENIFNSWINSSFKYLVEDKITGQLGLRPPQIGALHATLGHLFSDRTMPATIVMPTGTGKTETILSIVIAGKFERTLVVVPSDALRTQTAKKFINLGLLRSLGLVGETTLNPKVLSLNQGFDAVLGLHFLRDVNVIVATAQVLDQFSQKNLQEIAGACSHLIVDEAHHITAKTWNRVKECFIEKSVLQFTATPYRSDNKPVDGKMIFNYPIQRAQEEGYFKEIEFHPVKEFIEENADKVIADKAVEILKNDLELEYTHILMARAGTIKKAKEVFKIYQEYPEHNPVLVYSSMKNKKEVLESILAGAHQIIVCVDMFGEGFDLPELKIAALHSTHKSINITLQFAGRFTRTSGKNLGNAKFITNIADVRVSEALEELYNQDADWNTLIRDIGTRKISDAQSFQDFRYQFDESSLKLVDIGLHPKISTVIYKNIKERWLPEKLCEVVSMSSEILDSALNDKRDVLIILARSKAQVAWTHSQDLKDISLDLYVLFHDKEKDLLFVHSSSKDGITKKLISTVAKGATLISGDSVFRVFHGLKRINFQNIGLNRDRRELRYVMYSGSDLKEALSQLETRRARKSNLFAKGFEGGALVTVGCSHKGKVWAMESKSINVWIEWCKRIGKKVLDESINTNEILKTAMQSETIKTLPAIPIINIDWPDTLLRANEGRLEIVVDGLVQPFIEFELRIQSNQTSGNSLNFFLTNENEELKFCQYFHNNGEYKVINESARSVKIIIKNIEIDLDEFFNDHPPSIFLSDTSIIEGAYRHFCDENYLYPYDKNKIEVWDWSGVDISVESQGEERRKDSIQNYTITKIWDDYDLIFDDDDAGEVADIVAIKDSNEEIIIHLYHCKFCPKKDGVASPGARVKDAYEVTGQAIKSVRWIHSNEKLIERLLDREKHRLSKGKKSRINKGDMELLVLLRKKVRLLKTNYEITIVQPAFSFISFSESILSILGAGETYIKETTGVNLNIISSS